MSYYLAGFFYFIFEYPFELVYFKFYLFVYFSSRGLSELLFDVGFFFCVLLCGDGGGGEKINVLGAEKEGEMKEALGCLKKKTLTCLLTTFVEGVESR